MNDIQTPEWVKESIIKGLNRKKQGPLKYALSVSWMVIAVFAVEKYIQARQCVTKCEDKLIWLLWRSTQ